VDAGICEEILQINYSGKQCFKKASLLKKEKIGVQWRAALQQHRQSTVN
jgi:hypothetical protein